MINPKELVTPASSLSMKQEFLLFCILVAGKNADSTSEKLARFLSFKPEDQLPFDYLREKKTQIHNMLVANRVGQYNRIERAIAQAIEIDVENTSVSELQGIFGIGPKTARFFALHALGQEYAVLDTHILKWLKRYIDNVPTSTPQKEDIYQYWERIFISFSRSIYGNLPLKNIDLLIWMKESGRADG